MLHYRTFRNTDPPLLCATWRSRAGCPGLHQPVSVDLFEQLVFGKLHFDYEGLILAFDDDRSVGFAHASLGTDCQETSGSATRGVICMVCVRPDCAEAEVAAGLVTQCEEYLRRRGAATVFGGAAGPQDPFYLGLYGGCDLPGVLDCDPVAGSAFLACGFRKGEERLIFRRQLTDLRLPADRQQLQWRRRMTVQVILDPPARSWCEACTNDFDLTRFELLARGDATPLARAMVRTMGATPASPGGCAAGVIEFHVEPRHRRQGLATFLLAETLRTLASQGVSEVEAQTAEQDAAGTGLLAKLGFQPIGRGTIYRKDL